jgi:hypothetical protein
MAAVLATASLTSASTSVLMMPDRPALVNAPVVVWGNTTMASTSTYTLDFGDGSAAATGTATDPTYIFSTHAYTSAGTFTARLTVTDGTAMTSDFETAMITVTDPAAPGLDPFALRETRINMAIEDGLRWLYANQTSRTSTPTTSWSLAGNTMAGTSLVALAFEDHGHFASNVATKDIYQDVVQRALNFIFDQVSTQTLDLQTTGLNPAGNDPCVGPGIEARPCTGLASNLSYSGYTTSIATFAVAAAAGRSPARAVDAGLGSANGNFVEGRTYAEILQRLVNTVVWGQNDGSPGNVTCQEGGFQYYLNSGSDGSAIGWAVLALFDGAAAGAVVPPFVATELANVVARTSCTVGPGELALSYGSCYTADSSCNGDGSLNVAKAGVLLQALNYMGVPKTDARVQGAFTYISNRWEHNPDGGYFYCDNGNVDNKGCGYGMFNAFKGLKLYNESTLAGVTRPAGPAPVPASDWFEDYRDYLVTQQMSPSDPMSGQWANSGMEFSSQTFNEQVGSTALAEIILSGTALIPPSQIALAPGTATNPATTSHTVTATATTESGAPAPGVTVTFRVISGPDAGIVGSSTTDANGQASFTYTNNGTQGTDQIQASIGTLVSNVVTKIWSGFDPFGGLVRTNTRTIKLKLHRPPGTDGVRCIEAGDPKNPNFDDLPFTPFPEGSDDVEIDLTLTDGDGAKSVCCDFHKIQPSSSTTTTTTSTTTTTLGGEVAPTVVPADQLLGPLCGSIELVTTTAQPEICGNCIDDDGNGLVDYEDPACCNQPAALEVFHGRFNGLARKGHGRLRLRSKLGAIGISEQTPLSEDTTIQFRNANGELLCATVAHQHWMRMHGDSKFWDRSGLLAQGLQDGTIRVKKDGTIVFRTFSNIMDLSKYNQSTLSVTVRVGNKCSRGTVVLRQKKDRLIFP